MEAAIIWAVVWLALTVTAYVPAGVIGGTIGAAFFYRENPKDDEAALAVGYLITLVLGSAWGLFCLVQTALQVFSIVSLATA